MNSRYPIGSFLSLALHPHLVASPSYIRNNSEKFRGRTRGKVCTGKFSPASPSSSIFEFPSFPRSREIYGILKVDLKERNNLQDVTGGNISYFRSGNAVTASLLHAGKNDEGSTVFSNQRYNESTTKKIC